MPRWLWIVLFALSGYWWWTHHPTSVQAPVITTTSGAIADFSGAEVRYYTVEGNSAAALRESLNRRHPGWDGYTHWNIHWDAADGDCSQDPAESGMSITVDLPRWDPPADAAPELRQHWERYSQALTLHEAGHVQLAREGYARLQTALKQADCRSADQAANDVLQEMRAADIRYDSDTDHGATQGARFP